MLERLSDAQLDAACNAPRINKHEVFGPAEETFKLWLKRNRPTIERIRNPRVIVINAADNTRATGDTYDLAYEAYLERYGEAPAGRSILSIRISPP